MWLHFSLWFKSPKKDYNAILRSSETASASRGGNDTEVINKVFEIFFRWALNDTKLKVD